MEKISAAILFEKVTAHVAKQFPFVLYRKPDSETVIGMFQNDAKTNLVADFLETGYVFAPFNGHQVFIIPKSDSALYASEFTFKESLY